MKHAQSDNLAARFLNAPVGAVHYHAFTGTFMKKDNRPGLWDTVAVPNMDWRTHNNKWAALRDCPVGTVRVVNGYLYRKFSMESNSAEWECIL